MQKKKIAFGSYLLVLLFKKQFLCPLFNQVPAVSTVEAKTHIATFDILFFDDKQSIFASNLKGTMWF